MGVELKTSNWKHLSTPSKMADNGQQLTEEVNTVVDKTEDLVIEDVSGKVATENEETENVAENEKLGETETAAVSESGTTEEAATEVETEETIIDEKVEEGTEKETSPSPSEQEITPEEKAQ